MPDNMPTPPTVSPDATSGADSNPLPLTSQAPPKLTPMQPPAGMQPVTDPNAAPGTMEPHHGLIGTAFQDLAGGKKTVWRQTDSGPVPVKENLKPGEIAQNILAAALTGLAGGFGPGRHNAGAAFAGGFEAEAKAKQEQSQQQQTQAEQQFKNKQAADEMTLRKQQNAREQQDSILRQKTYELDMNKWKRAVEVGDQQLAMQKIDFDDAQTDRVNRLRQLGATPLKFADGTPIPEFKSIQEAATWASDPNHAKLAIQPGKYDTLFEFDPANQKYMILQKPKGWDDAQWLGVKTDADGNPVLDKDGKKIPDGTFKDPTTGKVVAPAGPITPHQKFDSQEKLIDLQDKRLSREEAIERIRGLRMANNKTAQENQADKEYNDALNAGGIDAIDPKTQKPILSASSRDILARRNVADFGAAAKSYQALQAELDKYVNTENPSDKGYAEGLQQRQSDVDDARELLHSLQTKQMILSRNPGTADTIAKNLKDQFGDDAANHIPEGVGSALQQAVRQKLAGPVYTTDQINAVVDQFKSGKFGKIDPKTFVDAQPVSPETKKALLQELMKVAPQAQPAPAPGTPPANIETMPVNAG